MSDKFVQELAAFVTINDQLTETGTIDAGELQQTLKRVNSLMTKLQSRKYVVVETFDIGPGVVVCDKCKRPF